MISPTSRHHTERGFNQFFSQISVDTIGGSERGPNRLTVAVAILHGRR
ncbi:hypothetical protein [Streptomyces sp. TE33382]